MFTSDSSGRVHPVASLQQFDRLSFQSLQEDVLELARVSDSGAVVLTPHLLSWSRSSSGVDRPHRPHHSTGGSQHQQAPIGFATDATPAFETHECTGTCARPFPPLLVEAAIQRYTWSSGGSESVLDRYQSALTLSDLFIAQCSQLLHSMRFSAGGGKDLFSQSFLHDIDDVMRSALWRGDSKGRKAAGDQLQLEMDEPTTAHSPSPTPNDYTARPAYDRATTMAASSATAAAAAAHASGSTANLAAAASIASNRRSSQDGQLINHPFAPAAYTSTSDGSHTARVISGPSGRGMSRRIISTTSSLHRPRQCLISSILALLRFANGLGVRLKYWRGQLKAKQTEIARLSTLAEAAKQAAATDAGRTESDPTAAHMRNELKLLRSKVETLEQTISEYESSGRTRDKVTLEFGDTHIPFGSRPTGADGDGPLAGQLAALRHELEDARQSNLTLTRESQELVASLRAEIAGLKSEGRSREDALEAVQSLADERELKTQQLEKMLQAIKERVGQREKEWEAKEKEWQSAGAGGSDSASAAAAAAAAKSAAAEYARKEAEWFASQSDRAAVEASLTAACTRAKLAHSSVLREYEDLRRDNVRVAEENDRERKEAAERLKKCQAQLTEARNTIAQLRAQLKKLTDQAQQHAPAPAPPQPTPPPQPKPAAVKDPLKEKKRAEAEAARRQAEEDEEAEEEAERVRAAQAAEVAAAAAAERIKIAAAKAKKEKLARKKEAEALIAAQQQAAEAAAAAAAAVEEKPAAVKKKKKRDGNAEGKEDQRLMPPPTEAELAKPTPKLSSGYGRCIYEEGEWYEGWWVDYERSGEGTYQWRDGRRYIGDWLKDKKHGHGQYFWVDGDRYEGNYVNDKMHGFGTYYFSDGTRYEGDWENDMSHGKGQFLYSDGAFFSGHFQRDQKHGPGVMNLPTGEVFSEHWVNGKRISSVSVKQQQNNMQQQQQQPMLQPQPPASSKHASRNIRLAAQEQLAMSARGPPGRR